MVPVRAAEGQHNEHESGGFTCRWMNPSVGARRAQCLPMDGARGWPCWRQPCTLRCIDRKRCVSFVVPAWNEAASLPRTLQALRAAADEVAAQGTVTTDILTRLMYSDLVLVDVTYPNPNVFYELGIRHACRSGTIIVRSKAADGAAPFDIGHQRYISYEEVLGGEVAAREVASLETTSYCVMDRTISSVAMRPWR